MEDDGIRFIQFESEEARLRYIIAQFKKYDAKRKRHMAHLQNLNDRYRDRIKELEKLTEHQHEEIDTLIASYDGAKGLIQNPSQRAWVYELIKKANDGKQYKTERDGLIGRTKQLQEQNKSLSERVKALEEIIKNLHNGKR